MQYLYRSPLLNDTEQSKFAKLAKSIGIDVTGVNTEVCFHITDTVKDTIQNVKFMQLLKESTNDDVSVTSTFAETTDCYTAWFEVGPRRTFSTPWCTNAVSICHAMGFNNIISIERFRRYRIVASAPIENKQLQRLVKSTFDMMTECIHDRSGYSDECSTNVFLKINDTIPLIGEGLVALKRYNDEKLLGLDNDDTKHYTELFINDIQRDPTESELYDIAQSNSLHGFAVSNIRPFGVDSPSPFRMVDHARLMHPILTTETYNFLTGVAPFPGAATATGNRLRDMQATRRGANTVAGISSYCVGNLHIPGYVLPWESENLGEYPTNIASPLDAIIKASDGTSDYGNKYGEPVIAGFVRSYGAQLPGQERREWIKPIMFSAGVGSIDDCHIKKGIAETGMKVIKIGGLAYPIGLGRGVASINSQCGDERHSDVDLDAVQRGDAEMGNRLNRVVRACIEMGIGNPIIRIRGQGAGSNSNALTEIVEPQGARYELCNISPGGETMTPLEIWTAEYQESNALLCAAENVSILQNICAREGCPMDVVGTVVNDGGVVVHDDKNDTTSVDMPLDKMMGELPQNTFTDYRLPSTLAPIDIPQDITVSDALDRVLRLLAVGSKRFITNKVDRSVSGLIAQQQCVGPLHTPLSNVAVVALSHFDTVGTAVACGEQPIKGLVSPQAQGRMTVGEALTNIIFIQLDKPYRFTNTPYIAQFLISMYEMVQ